MPSGGEAPRPDSAAPRKAGLENLQMPQHRPEQIFREAGKKLFVQGFERSVDFGVEIWREGKVRAHSQLYRVNSVSRCLNTSD